MLWGGSCFADYIAGISVPFSDSNLTLSSFYITVGDKPVDQILINSDTHGSIQVASNDNLFSVTTTRTSTGYSSTYYFNTYYPSKGMLNVSAPSDLIIAELNGLSLSNAVTGTSTNPYAPELDFVTTGSAGEGTYLNLSPQAITDLGNIDFTTDYNSYYFYPVTINARFHNNTQTDVYLPSTSFLFTNSLITNFYFPGTALETVSSWENKRCYSFNLDPTVCIRAGSDQVYSYQGYWIRPAYPLDHSFSVGWQVKLKNHNQSKHDRTYQIWERIGAFINQDKSEYDEFTESGSSAAYDSVVSDSSTVKGFGDSVEAVAVPVLHLFDGSRTFGEPDLVFPGLWVDVYHYSDRQNINAFYASVVPPAGSLQYSRVWSPYTFNFRTFFEQYHLGFLKTALNFATVFLVYSGLLKYLLDVWDKLMNGAYAGDIN